MTEEDTLTWVESGRPKLFGQLLAQQIASNYSIDPADEVEPVQSLSPSTSFKGQIIIEGKKKALEEGKKYRAGEVFWVDGSKLSQGNAGAAVSWKDKKRDCWKNSSVFLGQNKEIIDAELWAIVVGLEAVEKVTVQTSHRTAITIFSDSREALTTIDQLSARRTETPCLRNLIYQKVSDLEKKGKSISIRWIPSHAGLVGHDKADHSAKEKAQKGGKPVEQWSSLGHIKTKMMESYARELANLHEAKFRERKTSRQGFYIPRTEKGMSKVLGHAPKKYVSRYLQLKVGHGAVGSYLARIGLMESPQCWWCGQAEQSVEHLYTKCRRWRKERRKLLRTLYKEGIRWQGWTEKKGLAGMLANEKAMGPLLEFLKSTEVGARRGAEERKLEWQQRSDRAGEELQGE